MGSGRAAHMRRLSPVWPRPPQNQDHSGPALINDQRELERALKGELATISRADPDCLPSSWGKVRYRTYLRDEPSSAPVDDELVDDVEALPVTMRVLTRAVLGCS